MSWVSLKYLVGLMLCYTLQMSFFRVAMVFSFLSNILTSKVEKSQNIWESIHRRQFSLGGSQSETVASVMGNSQELWSREHAEREMQNTSYLSKL